MKTLYRLLIAGLLLLSSINTIGQQNEGTAFNTLSFEEYIAYVKQHHPLLKQANLQLNVGEAYLLKARGGFDPKIEVDYDRKKFKSTEYYDQLNGAFKLPTWYGLEFKLGMEQNSGEFLDPSLSVPDDGLYSAGVSLSLLEGFLINERMADVKKAKFFVEQTLAERELLVNDLIFKASMAYFQWVEATNEQAIYNNFLVNAQERLEAIKTSVIAGDKAAIDSTEASITAQSRTLALEAARLKATKARLAASNYLWINDIPLEVNEKVLPLFPDQMVLRSSLYLPENVEDTQSLENHPKIRSLDAKINSLKVDRRYKRNRLLPTLDLEYNFLTPNRNRVNTLNTADYKAGLNFSVPLFLRKERGDLKLASLKLQSVELDQAATLVTLKNNIRAVQTEIISLQTQTSLISNIVTDYETLVRAEERKFELGEGSLFLINSREQKLIEASLKANETQIKFLGANASLFNALGMGTPLPVN